MIEYGRRDGSDPSQLEPPDNLPKIGFVHRTSSYTEPKFGDNAFTDVRRSSNSICKVRKTGNRFSCKNCKRKCAKR